MVQFTLTPQLANLGKVSTFHTEKRNTKRKEIVVAIGWRRQQKNNFYGFKAFKLGHRDYEVFFIV
jgi:hypothetical protein